MTKNEVNRFRAILNERIAELENFNRQRDGITIERSPDQLDEIQRASERALAVCNLDREFNKLRNIRAALLRIEQGRFGKCEECDEEIHPKRLAAIPWAALCIRCQEALDHNPEQMPTAGGEFLANAA